MRRYGTIQNFDPTTNQGKLTYKGESFVFKYKGQRLASVGMIISFKLERHNQGLAVKSVKLPTTVEEVQVYESQYFQQMNQLDLFQSA